MGISAWAVLLVPAALISSVCCKSQAEVNHAKEVLSKLPRNCGETDVFELNIVEGTPAPLGKFPWMVALGYPPRRSPKPGEVLVYHNNKAYSVLCGGSLITDQWVLSAAHCMDTRRPAVARLGDLDLDETVNDGATSAVTVPISQIKVHDQYDKTAKINDVALIKIENKVKFVEGMLMPICLPDKVFFNIHAFEGEETTVAGWGVLETKKYTTHLMEVQVHVTDLEDCRKNYTEANKNLILDDKVVCAGGKYSELKDACSGDSGGPQMKYVVRDGKEKAYLMGVVSYGLSCAKPGYPGVYARVSSMMKWIINNLEV